MLSFVVSHLSAHHGAVEKRNQDFRTIASAPFPTVLGLGPGRPTARAALVAARMQAELDDRRLDEDQNQTTAGRFLRRIEGTSRGYFSS